MIWTQPFITESLKNATGKMAIDKNIPDDISCVYAARQLAPYLQLRRPKAPSWVRKTWQDHSAEEEAVFQAAGLERPEEKDAFLVMQMTGARMRDALFDYLVHNNSDRMSRDEFELLFLPDGIQCGLVYLGWKYLQAPPEGDHRSRIVSPDFAHNAREWICSEVYSRNGDEFNLLDSLALRTREGDRLRLRRDVKDVFDVRRYAR